MPVAGCGEVAGQRVYTVSGTHKADEPYDGGRGRGYTRPSERRAPGRPWPTARGLGRDRAQHHRRRRAVAGSAEGRRRPGPVHAVFDDLVAAGDRRRACGTRIGTPVGPPVEARGAVLQRCPDHLGVRTTARSSLTWYWHICSCLEPVLGPNLVLPVQVARIANRSRDSRGGHRYDTPTSLASAESSEAMASNSL
jgi:hypothetical protein